MPALSRGEKFYAKSTETNRNCGIRAGDRGFVTHLTQSDVSFYLERRAGFGYVEATCPLDVFAGNFTTDWRLGGLNPDELADGGQGNDVDLSYAASRPFLKRFPQDLRI